MAESMLEVVGKLQSRLAGSSEPKKVMGPAVRPGLPLSDGGGAAGPGVGRAWAVPRGDTGSGAGPGRACPPSDPPCSEVSCPASAAVRGARQEVPGESRGRAGWLSPVGVAAPAVPRESRCSEPGSLRGGPPMACPRGAARGPSGHRGNLPGESLPGDVFVVPGVR